MHLILSYCAFSIQCSMQCSGLGQNQAVYSVHKVNTGLPHVLGELLPCHFPFHLSSFIVYSRMLNQFVAKLVGTLCACTFCRGNYMVSLKSCNFWFELSLFFSVEGYLSLQTKAMPCNAVISFLKCLILWLYIFISIIFVLTDSTEAI